MSIQLGPFLSELPATTGNRFFVDSGSTNAADGNRGQDPSKPLATIDGGINRCTANNGDQVVVMPGHSESLDAAGDVALDVAGVSVIGLGQGHTRPQVVYNTAAGSVMITASNVRWSNIVHVCSVAATTNAIIADNTIQNVEIDHCHFTFDATGVEFTVMVKLGNGGTDSADYVNIHDNWFEAENIDGCGSAILIDDCQFVHIVSNLFTGDFNSVAIDGAAASSACLDYVILDNVVSNYDTGLTIDLDDAATGFAANNRVGGGGAIAAIADWGNLLTAENYVCDALDTKGIVIPPTAST